VVALDNTLLWGLQALLALILFPAAATRALSYEFAKKRMAWVAAVPRSLLLFISVAEILGAIGLVLPGLTHVAPQLIPVAAVGLGLIQMLAFVFHTARGEFRNASANLVLLGALVFVAAGRLVVSP